MRTLKFPVKTVFFHNALKFPSHTVKRYQTFSQLTVPVLRHNNNKETISRARPRYKQSNSFEFTSSRRVCNSTRSPRAAYILFHLEPLKGKLFVHKTFIGRESLMRSSRRLSNQASRANEMSLTNNMPTRHLQIVSQYRRYLN